MKPELRIITLLEADRPVILITVIDKQGSGPRSPGAKIVVVEDGTFWGTVGGGQVENRALDFAGKFFYGRAQAATAHFQLKPGFAGENIDMLCGGRVSLLFEKFLPGDDLDQFQNFQKLDGVADAGLWVINLDYVETRQRVERFVVAKNGEVAADLASLKEHLFGSGKSLQTSCLIEFNGSSWFVDKFSNSGHLILVGAGHVALEVAKLAHSVNFDVAVCDNRAEFAHTSRFPMVDTVAVVEEYRNIFEQVRVGADGYIVILTHGHTYDQTALEQALQTDAGYVGMIGSSRKKRAIYANLRNNGIAAEQLEAVHCPIGLEIGAESPVEIGISIIAELIRERVQ